MAKREPTIPPIGNGGTPQVGAPSRIRTFDSISDLKAQNMAAVKDGEVAVIMDAGDALTFYYDASSSDADDSGDSFITTVAPNSGGGRWKRQIEKSILYEAFISDTAGTEPSSGKAVDGVLGLYENANGYYQFLKYDATNGWEDFGNPISSKSVSDGLDSRLDVVETAQSAGVIGFADKATMDADTTRDDQTLALVTNDATSSNNGWYRWDSSSSTWVASEGFFSAATVKQWVASEAFSISNITYSSAGNVESATLVWPDGEAGTISNLSEDSNGRISSMRFNYVGGKYITVTLTYNDELVESVTLTATGF